MMSVMSTSTATGQLILLKTTATTLVKVVNVVYTIHLETSTTTPS